MCWECGYDVNGNMTARPWDGGTQTLTYNYENRVVGFLGNSHDIYQMHVGVFPTLNPQSKNLKSSILSPRARFLFRPLPALTTTCEFMG